jgi:general secretion pathway protein D
MARRPTDDPAADAAHAASPVTRRTARRAAVLCLTLIVATGAPGRARAQEPATTTRLSYVDADLRDVIRSLATSLGLNVVLVDVPATRVTFSTPNPVPIGQLGAVLETILEAHGLVLVHKGPIAQVTPIARAPAAGLIHYGKDPPPVRVGLVTQVVPLQFIRADEAVAAIRQVGGPTTRVDVVPRSNSVVITDRVTNVIRFLELLRQLDVRGDGEAGLRTFVYRLRHASAVELAATLSQLFGVPVALPQPRPRVQAFEERSLSRNLEGFRRRTLESLDQRRQATLPVAPPAAAPQRGDTAAQQAAGLVGQTSIVADQATNSLVIRTSPPNIPVLQETITQLDVRPPQVLLEVLVAEVTLDRTTQFGINWSAFGTRRGGRDSIGVTFGPELTDSALKTLQDFTLRVVTLDRVDVRAIVRALASRTNVRVLSTPHILALNNEEARILVGSEVPFSQSSFSGFGGPIVDRIVQFRDVGTQLTIIPTINQDRYVTFRILQEVSALTQETVAAALNAPIITIREAETSALVRDGSTIVIGGLIDEGRTLIESGVPILKDIPLLGFFFRSRTTSRARTELAIFLTPHVVFTDAEAEGLLRREQERLRESRDDVNRTLQEQRQRPTPRAPPR